MSKKIVFFFAFIFLCGANFNQASAARMDAGELVNVPSSETVSENFYGVGSQATITGNVTGDAYLASPTVFIQGLVSQDVTAVGGTVTITGNVGGDVRVAAGDVTISGNVNGDVLVFGGNVHILSGVSIGGDVFVAGGNIILDNLVFGKTTVRGGRVVLNGQFISPVSVNVSDDIKIRSNAIVNAGISYSAPREATVEEGAQLQGTIDFAKKADVISDSYAGGSFKAKGFVTGVLALFGIWWLIKSAMMIAVGLILVRFFEKKSIEVIKTSSVNFWSSALRGFVVLVMIPIAIIVVCATVVGMFVGIIALFAYILLICVSGVYASIILGGFINDKIFRKKAWSLASWQAVVVGALVFEALKFIPIAGWAITCLFFLSALGSLSLYSYNKYLIKN